MSSPWVESLKHSVEVDIRKVPYAYPLRTAAILAVSVGAQVATGHISFLIPSSVAILFIGLLDAPDPLRTRFHVWLRSSFAFTVAVLGAVFVASDPVLRVIATGAVAALCGYVGIIGTRCAVGGLLTLVLFTVFAGTPEYGFTMVETPLAVLGGCIFYGFFAFVTTPLMHMRRRIPIFTPLPWRSALFTWHGIDNGFVRHAIRLAVVIMIGTVLAEVLDFPHAYWIPMTVAWVSKPDFSGTVNKVVYRVLGTLLGLAVVSTVFTVFPNQVSLESAMVVLGCLIVCMMIWINYSYSTTGITIFVISLFSIEHDPLSDTVPWRIVSTLIAGVLVAAAAYIWPTRPPSVT
jgi:hypothetical protein